MSELGPEMAGLLSMPAALCGALLALAALAVGTAPRWLRAAGQCFALLAFAVALGPLLTGAVESLWGYTLALPPATRELQELFERGAMSGAISLMYAATAIALTFTPLRT